MQSFLQQNGQLPQEPLLDPSAMEQMRRDLDGFRMRSPLMRSENWNAEFRQQEPSHSWIRRPEYNNGNPTTPTSFSTKQFQHFHASSPLNAQMHQRSDVPAYQSSHVQNAPDNSARESERWAIDFKDGMPVLGPPTYNQNVHMPAIGGAALQDYQMQLMLLEQQNKKRLLMSSQERGLSNGLTRGTPQTSKGGSHLIELDDSEWEKQFDEINAIPTEETDAQARQAMEQELDQMDRSVPQHSETNMGDFESIWRAIKAESSTNRTLNGTANGDELGVHLPDDMLNDINTWDAFDGQFADPVRDPQLGNYMFEEQNPYSGTTNPYEEGLKIVEEGGNLSLAALAFEAAVQKSPEHVDAWAQLGSAQAQNEKEGPAIRSWTQCLRLDEAHLGALMGLAISYINEGYDTTAFRTLERWLSTKYPEIIPASALSPDTELGFTDRHQLHEKVTDLFIQAAQLSPGGDQMDPDVQVGLGVLFYGAEEYAKAVDCFEAALASTEQGTSNSSGQTHLLWNRLGATLANSGRSEEAITAYEKALTLNPNFVRARYNLGVSCINIGVFEQAAQHLLGALSMHRVVEREGMERVKEVVGENVEEDEVERLVAMNQSTNLLETLRRVFQSMGRRDLAEKVEVGMDIEMFRGDFDF